MKPSPAPVTLAEVAAVAREVADAARETPVEQKAWMVAVYLEKELNRMSGARLCELRSAANLSQAEFAACLGISQSTVSDMERGRRPVSAATAMSAMRVARRALRAKVRERYPATI